MTEENQAMTAEKQAMTQQQQTMTEEKKAKLTDFDKKAVVFCIYRKLRIKELSSE